MYENAQAFKLGTKTCLQATALVMAIMLASGFLATIPTVQAIPSNNNPVTAIPVRKPAPPNDQSTATIPVVKTAQSNGESAATAVPITETALSNIGLAAPIPAIKAVPSDDKTVVLIPVLQTVASSDDLVVLTFVARINETEARSFSVNITKPKSLNENMMKEMADEIQLTEEQKSILAQAQSIKIMASPGYYMEFVRDTRFQSEWLTFGVSVHIYLDKITAINTRSALAAMAVLFGLLTAILLPTAVGAILALVIAAVVAMIEVDFGRLYDEDRNSDGSLDMWLDVMYFLLQCNIYYVETPHYGWLCSIVGAYIVVDKTTGWTCLGVNKIQTKGGGGGQWPK